MTDKSYQKLEEFLTDHISFHGNAEGCGAYIETMSLKEMVQLRELLRYAIAESLYKSSPTVYKEIFPENV